MNIAEQLEAEAARRILVKDGAFGTEVQARGLKEADYRGDLTLNRDQKGNNDLLSITRPALIAEIVESFADAGADVLATNTFNANRISQADYGAESLVADINVSAARIARAAADRHAQTDGRPRFVAGAIGPTNKTLSLSPNVNDPGYREIDFDFLSDVYVEQAEALLEGGADLILIETVFDTLNAKAGIHAVRRIEERRGQPVPLMLSMTITDLSGRNLSGHSIEAFWASVRHANPIAIGLNCSFGAAQLRAHVATLSGIADTLLIAYPNAGLPNELGDYDECPDTTSSNLKEWAGEGLVNIVGGCCGTTPAHIRMIAERVRGLAPRAVPGRRARMQLAGIEPMTLAA